MVSKGLTDKNLGFVSELVRGYLHVTADIGVRAKAQAELRIIRCTSGDAVQVGSDAKGFEGAVLVGLLIMEGVHGDGGFGGDLVIAVLDEDGLATPLDGVMVLPTSISDRLNSAEAMARTSADVDMEETNLTITSGHRKVSKHINNNNVTEIV